MFIIFVYIEKKQWIINVIDDDLKEMSIKDRKQFFDDMLKNKR